MALALLSSAAPAGGCQMGFDLQVYSVGFYNNERSSDQNCSFHIVPCGLLLAARCAPGVQLWGSSSCTSSCSTQRDNLATPAGIPGAAVKIHSQIGQISKPKAHPHVSGALGNLLPQVQGIGLSGRDVLTTTASRGWFWGGGGRSFSH